MKASLRLRLMFCVCSANVDMPYTDKFKLRHPPYPINSLM